MAPTPASLTIDFISNYAGSHRVCYRIAPAVLYDCTTIVTCTGGGAACQAIISILVDNETCDPVTYEGYVQATCEAEGSLTGRIPFSIVFTPNPVCDSYRVTCDNVGLDSVIVVDGGTGFDPLVPPVITVFSASGIGAAATAVVGSGRTTTNPGAGYTPGVYPGVPVINVIGTGTGAIATVTVGAGGDITSNVFTTSGSGYFPGDTYTFNDADLGGGGGAGFAAGFNAGYGVITAINVTLPGSGYQTVAGIVIPSPTLGSDASATAVMEICPDQVMGTSCDGSPAQTVTNMSLGQSAIECMSSLPVILPEFTIVAEGCCYDCVQLTMAADALNPTETLMYYTDCDTHLIVETAVAPGGSIGPICAVNNSWYYSPDTSTVVITVGVDC